MMMRRRQGACGYLLLPSSLFDPCREGLGLGRFRDHVFRQFLIPPFDEGILSASRSICFLASTKAPSVAASSARAV